MYVFLLCGISLSTCMHVRMYMVMHACMCVYVCICVCICLCVRVRVCICVLSISRSMIELSGWMGGMCWYVSHTLISLT